MVVTEWSVMRKVLVNRPLQQEPTGPPKHRF
jgi:hypothetical protein